MGWDVKPVYPSGCSGRFVCSRVPSVSLPSCILLMSTRPTAAMLCSSSFAPPLGYFNGFALCTSSVTSGTQFVAKVNSKVLSWLTTVNASGRSVPFLVQSAKKSGTEFEQKSPRQLGKFSPSFERTIQPPNERRALTAVT